MFDFLGFTQWDRLLKLYLSGPVHHTPNLMLFDCADVLGRTHPITEKAIKMCQDTYLVYPLPNLPTATAITSFFQRQQYCKYVQTWGGRLFHSCSTCERWQHEVPTMSPGNFQITMPGLFRLPCCALPVCKIPPSYRSRYCHLCGSRLKRNFTLDRSQDSRASNRCRNLLRGKFLVPFLQDLPPLPRNLPQIQASPSPRSLCMASLMANKITEEYHFPKILLY